MKDFPLIEVEETANRIIADGGFVFQKWTCGGCGQRITANDRNVFTLKGHCEECDFTTDLLVTGCNYVAFMPVGKKGKEDRNA